MNRRGIALLATLWLVAALSVVAAATLTLARIERGAAVNRAALRQGRWAAEACLALAEAARDESPVVPSIDSVDFGEVTWCRMGVEDLGARVALDPASAPILAALVRDPGRAASLLDWLDPDDLPREEGAEREWYRSGDRPGPRNGPMMHVAELYQVRGFDSATVAALLALVRTGSVRRINVNVAPRELLLALPGLSPDAVDLIVQRRLRGTSWPDLESMLSSLPPNLRASAYARYAELQGLTTTTPEAVALHLEGHVPEGAVVTRTTVVAAPTPGRLAILTREEW